MPFLRYKRHYLNLSGDVLLHVRAKSTEQEQQQQREKKQLSTTLLEWEGKGKREN